MAGTSATTWVTSPSVHYHPHSQAGSVSKTGDVITACPDLMGLASLTAGSTTGPIELTDAAGRKFWRFNGAQWATISNALNTINNRAYAVAAVLRVHHQRSFCNIVMPRFATYTSDSVNTQANASIRFLAGRSVSNSAMGLQGTDPGPFTNATDGYKAIPGAQLHVGGVASRTTANGGQRIYMNNDTCDVAQATNSVTGYVGAIIGGSRGPSNTATVVADVNNIFDLYELAFWNSSQTNANMDANIAAMVSNWEIPAIDTTLLLDGDSITDGIATTLATSPAWAGSVGSQLCNPGDERIPKTVSVINRGFSGSQISDILARRDGVNSVAALPRPGGPTKNKVIIQIGRNNVAPTAGNQNSGQVYSALVPVFNTTTTGYLQRGWECYCAVNIAGTGTPTTTNNSPVGENTIQKRIEGIRALVANEATKTPQPQLLTDTLTNSGQAFEGRLKLIHLYAITQGGNAWFYDTVSSADFGSASPPGPYDSDFTHLTAEGSALMASGGDTPQFGYVSAFATAAVTLSPANVSFTLTAAAAAVAAQAALAPNAATFALAVSQAALSATPSVTLSPASLTLAPAVTSVALAANAALSAAGVTFAPSATSPFLTIGAVFDSLAPVSLAEAKAHLREDSNDNDDLITSLVHAAADYIEAQTGIVCRARDVLAYVDTFGPRLTLLKRPVNSVATIAYDADDGTEKTLTTWRVREFAGRPVIVPAYDEQFPQTEDIKGAVRVTYNAGYNSNEDISASVKQAALLLVAHWFANREAVVSGNVSDEIAFTVNALLSAHKRGHVG